MTSDTPWMKFYPRDWRGDQSLRAVSLAARGLWIECMCIMHEAKPYGHLVLGDQPVSCDVLSRMTGNPPDEIDRLLGELETAGVFSRTGKGIIYSRRMTKDRQKANKGRKAAKNRWSKDTEKQSEKPPPNGSPNGSPITQSPEGRSQNHSDPNGSGAKAPPNAKAKLFGPFLDWLAEETGKSKDRYRSLMGKWIKNYGLDAVLQVCIAAFRESPLDPVPWIEAGLKARAGPADGKHRPTWREREVIMWIRTDGRVMPEDGDPPGEAEIVQVREKWPDRCAREAA